MKKSDAAADDVEGSGVAVADAAAADAEACGVADDAGVTDIPGMKISDKVVSCSVCGVADADATWGESRDGEFNALNRVIAAGADDVDGCGDAAMGCCGEAATDSTRLRSWINCCSWR